MVDFVCKLKRLLTHLSSKPNVIMSKGSLEWRRVCVLVLPTADSPRIKIFNKYFFPDAAIYLVGNKGSAFAFFFSRAVGQIPLGNGSAC